MTPETPQDTSVNEQAANELYNTFIHSIHRAIYSYHYANGEKKLIEPISEKNLANKIETLINSIETPNFFTKQQSQKLYTFIYDVLQSDKEGSIHIGMGNFATNIVTRELLKALKKIEEIISPKK